MQKNENKLMAENTSKEISHHADELESAVHKTAHIPAWVIAKLERSSTDLSDVTHYLDGDPKFAQGGGIVNLDKIKNNIGEVLYKFIGSLNKEQAERMLTDLKAEIEFELKTQSTSARYSRLIDEQNLLLYRLGRDSEMKMAQGGNMQIPRDLNFNGIYTFKTKESREYKFAIVGFEKLNMTEIMFYFSGWNRDENDDLRSVIVKFSNVRKMAKGLPVPARTSRGENGKLTRIGDSFMGKPVDTFAQGGEIDEDEKYELAEKLEQDVTSYISDKKGISEDEAMAIIQDQNGREYFADTISFTKDVKSKWSTIVQNLGDEFISINDDEDFSYENGGEIEEEGVNLFEDEDNIPPKVMAILDKYSDAFMDGEFEELHKCRKQLEKIGYTMDIGMGGEAMNLRKIGQKPKYADGGGVENDGVTEYADWMTIKSMSELEKLPKVKFKGDSDDDFYYLLSEGNGYYSLLRNDEAEYFLESPIEMRHNLQAVVSVDDYEMIGKFADGGGVDEELVYDKTFEKYVAEDLMKLMHITYKQADDIVNTRQAYITMNMLAKSDVHFHYYKNKSLDVAKKIVEMSKEKVNEVNNPKIKSVSINNKIKDYYIEFLNRNKNYKKDKKYFDTIPKAKKWGMDNLNNFNEDMIFRSPDNSKIGDNNLELVNFDLNKLNGYEKIMYNAQKEGLTKADILQNLINNSNRNSFELSPKLSKIAKSQNSNEEKKYSDGGTTPKQQKKIGKVMHEFKEGDLKTSAGTKVTNPKQAVAIALSEAGVPKKGWGHKKTLRK
jgi:hypothetical protein